MKFTIDSRQVEPGDVFIPIKGNNYDGHDFIKDVRQKGGTVLDRPLFEIAAEHRKKFDLPIIAISGSSGKTTLKDMLSHILSTRYSVVKNDQNNNNEIGVPLTLLKLRKETEIAVIEVGARHPGDIAQLVEIIKPTDVCLTNIGVAHLEIFGDRQTLAAAKAELIYPQSRFYLNNNIDFKEMLLDKASQNNCQVIEYEAANTLEQNQAAAFKIAEYFGIDQVMAADSLKIFETSEHRLKSYIDNDTNFITIDDSYNSNPDSLKYIIKYIYYHYPEQKKIFILGDMLELGMQSKQLHQMIEIPKDAILLTLGEVSNNIQGGFLHKHYRDQASLITDLPSLTKDRSLAVVKGSRALKMESIVEYLRKGTINE